MPISLLLFLAVSGCPSHDTTAYKGHRVLAWAIAKESGDVSGFASGAIKPETSLKLEPTKDCVVTYEWGAVEAGGWMEEPMVSKTIRYDGGSAQGSASLVEPQWSFHCFRKPVIVVTFISPLGTTKSAKLDNMVTGELKGTRGELEDLAMTSLVDGGYDYDEGVKTIAQKSRTVTGFSLMPSRCREVLVRAGPKAVGVCVVPGPGGADGVGETGVLGFPAEVVFDLRGTRHE